MATRNIGRRRFRNLLIVFVIALSTSLMVGVMSSMSVIPAQFSQMITKTIGVTDIEIRSSFDLPFSQSALSLINEVKGVEDASPRIIGEVEIWNKTNSNDEWLSTSLYGVNPNTDFDYLDPNTDITGERKLTVTSAVVDEKLGFKIGDVISVRIPTEEDYSSSIYNFTVTGLYKQDITFLVKNRLYVDLTSARVILGYSENEADSIIVRVADVTDTERVLNDLNSKLGLQFMVSAPRKTQTKTMQKSMQGLYAGMAEFSLIATLIGGILILVVQQKSVSERTHEIGIMKSLGTSTAQVFWVFISENLILGILGVSLGLVFGATIVRIVFQDLISGVIGSRILGSNINQIPVEPQTLIFVALVGMFTVVGASAYPSLVACRKKVMQALLPKMTKPSKTKIPLIGIEIRRERIAVISVLIGATFTVLEWYSYMVFESYHLSGYSFYAVSIVALLFGTIGVILLLGGLIRVGAGVIERILPFPLGCKTTISRNTQRNLTRTMGLICIISVSASLIPLFAGVEVDTVNGMSDVIRSFTTSDITIASKTLIDSSFVKNLTGMDYGTIISYATPVLIVPGRTLINNVSRQQPKSSITILTIDPQTYYTVMPIKFTNNTPPDTLEKLQTDGTIILTSPLATSLNVTVNDVVLTNIVEWVINPKNPFFPMLVTTWKKLTIIGLADTADFLQLMQTGGFSLAGACYMSYNTFNKTYNKELPMFIGKSNLFYIDAKTGNIAHVKSRIMDTYGSYNLSIFTYDDMFNLVKPSMNVVFFIFDILQWFVFSITAVAILLVMWMAINERIPELGMMIAVGTSKTQIITIVLGEAILYGLFGFLASVPQSLSSHRIAVGVMSAMGFSTTFTLPSIIAFVVSFLLAIMTSLIGSLYPSWMAANLNAIQAVKYIE